MLLGGEERIPTLEETVDILAAGDVVLRCEIKPGLAALVLKPRVNLTRFHGVFAPNRR